MSGSYWRLVRYRVKHDISLKARAWPLSPLRALCYVMLFMLVLYVFSISNVSDVYFRSRSILIPCSIILQIQLNEINQMKDP